MINKNPQPFHVLITAAGSGQRFADETPKQYKSLYGKTILRHTIESFLNCPGLQSVQVIISPEHTGLYNESVKGLNLPPPALGGPTRKESVHNGIKELSHLKDSDMLLIHDAARPCITHKDILKTVDALKEHKAASLAAPISDTLRRSEDMLKQEDVQRDNLYGLQTPQGFHYGLIQKAHEHSDTQKTYTDDTQLILSMGENVKLIEGAKSNIKLTTKEDWTMIEKLLAPTQKHTRTGLGFDVHAFDNNAQKPLILCGIEIDHPKPLKGHSDADVGLHTITDALLGAIGAGDIGDHFPPSNPDFKDMDSAIFLQKSHDLIKDKNGEIINIDLTIICEAPKIGPHKQAMQTRIAEILEIAPGKINVKATTTEQLGFTGRGEGIAAQAIASVSLPR